MIAVIFHEVSGGTALTTDAINMKPSCGLQQVLMGFSRTVNHKWPLFNLCFYWIAISSINLWILWNESFLLLCASHMTHQVTVGGVPSPEAEPPGSGGCQEEWRVGEASRTSTPCTGLKSTYGPVPPGSSVSTSAPHWKSPTGPGMNPLSKRRKLWIM